MFILFVGNPTKRRSYDSVDPEFDDALPTAGEIERNFFKICDKYFTLNCRWSEKKHVPKIGKMGVHLKIVPVKIRLNFEFNLQRNLVYFFQKVKCLEAHSGMRLQV